MNNHTFPVADSNGIIVSSHSKFVTVHMAPITREMRIPNQDSHFPDRNGYLFVVIHFADEMFLFSDRIKGNPRDFCVAPYHVRNGHDVAKSNEAKQRIKHLQSLVSKSDNQLLIEKWNAEIYRLEEVVCEQGFDATEYHNSIWNRLLNIRIADQQFNILNSNVRDSIQRPVFVQILTFDRKEDRDGYSVLYQNAIDLTNNRKCLNHSSYDWLIQNEIGIKRNPEAVKRKARVRANRDSEAMDRQLQSVHDDTQVYHLARDRGNHIQIEKGTKAQLIKKFKFTPAELDVVIRGGKAKGFISGDKAAFDAVRGDV
ncbi:hypothetical protein [Paracoccus sp. (in: a-proteobacteria)]|uniref:hypothetical protein n=1 Tax=Paracoccus sp. TaxID=267 RepID=UPI004059E55D